MSGVIAAYTEVIELVSGIFKLYHVCATSFAGLNIEISVIMKEEKGEERRIGSSIESIVFVFSQ